MATAVGTLQSSLQASAAALSGNDFLINRKELHRKQRTRLACSPTCTLQLRKDDAVNQSQRIQFDPLFNRRIPRGLDFETLTQDRRQDLDVENAKQWNRNGEYLRSRRIKAELVNLATLAFDRTEMQTTPASQREDNWNLLFHSTISLTSVCSASAAAINGAGHQAPGLCVVASILGLGTAALMALVSSSFQQPSKLAEEERPASRFFRRLTVEVEATLDECPSCSEAKSSYVKEKRGKLQVLDRGSPLPLAPIFLERFPEAVRASVLSESPVSIDAKSRVDSLQRQQSNGRTSEIEEQLLEVTSLLHSSDIPASVGAAEKVNHVNKLVAVASPVLALTGSFLNVMPAMVDMQGAGAAIMVCALFVHSLSSGLQLGALYENHRNVAGHHADVDRSMESTLRVPVEERQDGRLFLERIALQLRRDPSESSVLPHGQEKAGMLF